MHVTSTLATSTMGATRTPKGRPRKAAQSTSSRKCGDAPKDLAAKKKHVRELARRGDWGEIGRLYGDKMVAKAKTYVEKKGPRSTVPAVIAAAEPPKVTPQMLAKQILAKNGYENTLHVVQADSVGIDGTHGRQQVPPPESRPKATSPAQQTQQNGSRPTRSTPDRTTRGDFAGELQNSVCLANAGLESKASDSNVEPTVILDSPEKLTEQQKRMIEIRRRQALEKRKRAGIPSAPSAGASTGSVRPKLISPGSDACKRPPAVDAFVQQELEIAAQITDWDIEEPARPSLTRLVTPPSPTKCRTGRTSDPSQNSTYKNQGEIPSEHSVSSRPDYTAAVPLPTIAGSKGIQGKHSVSISQELAAAAEIEWFDFDEPENVDKGKDRPKDVQSAKPSSTEVEMISPKTTEIVVNNDLDEFVAQHFLDDKFDAAVLDFVNMMLG